MNFDRKSYILGILTVIGLTAFVGVAFADSEIGDRIVALWFHGNVSNTTGYKYYNLTGIPVNITRNDTINNFTVNQTFSEGINSKMVNLTFPVHVKVQNTTTGDLFSPNVVTRVKFLNEIVDNYNAWDGQTFVTPFTGYYSISSSLRLYNDSSFAGTDFVEDIYTNGVLYTRLWASNRSKVFNGGLGSGSLITNLTAGDTVEIFTYSNDYYRIFGDATNKYSTLEIIKIG